MKAARIMFAATVEAKMDYQCPATQDAIDRIAAAAPFSTRQTMLDCIRSNGSHLFSELMLIAWVPAGRKGLGLHANDLVLVTGHDRDWWIGMIDAPEGNMGVQS